MLKEISEKITICAFVALLIKTKKIVTLLQRIVLELSKYFYRNSMNTFRSFFVILLKFISVKKFKFNYRQQKTNIFSFRKKFPSKNTIIIDRTSLKMIFVKKHLPIMKKFNCDMCKVLMKERRTQNCFDQPLNLSDFLKKN